MNKTMYLNYKMNNDFVQAADWNQSLSFCVHIFDKETGDFVKGI